jgi:hypothetical protein
MAIGELSLPTSLQHPPRRKQQQLPSPFSSLQDLPQKKAMVVVVAFFFFATAPQ